MTTDQLKFITSILGSDGSNALNKAVERCQPLESVLLPRSILSWLNTVSNIGYEGTIPGVDNSYITFEKSEDGFNGSVTMGDYMYNFEKSNVFHMAASIALSLGIEPSKDINVKDLDIEKLGKSIDLLVKAKIVTNELLAKKPKIKDEDLEKDGKEAPGGAAAPLAPTPAAEPMPTAATSVKRTEKPKMPRLPKPSKIKVAKSEFNHKCSLCASSSFDKAIYVGCLCMKDLAKSVKTEGEYLILGTDWDSDAILALYESIGRND